MALRFLRRSTKNATAFDIVKPSEYGIGFFLKTPTFLFNMRSHQSAGVCTGHGCSKFHRHITRMSASSERARNISTNSKVGSCFLTSMNKSSQYLSGNAINISTNANTKYGLRSLNFTDIHSQFRFLHRMLSTSSSSHQSGSNYEDEKKEDANISSTPSIDKFSSQQVEKKSFQSMLRQYGKVFIATYMAVYVTTVLGLFASVQSGQLDATYMISLITGSSSPDELVGAADPDIIKQATSEMNNLVKILESYTMTRPVAPMVEQYPWTANFAIAWIATKFTEPIRFGVTVVVTPPLSKFLGYRSTPAAVKNGPIQVVYKRGDTSAASNSSNTVKNDSEM